MSQDEASVESNKPSPLVQKGILPDDCRMLVVGDSHSRFWAGQDGIHVADRIPQVTTYHVGAALAYNLVKVGSSSGGLERVTKVLDLIAKRGAMPEFLMFSFGEIDIRAHVVRRAVAQGIPLDRGVAAVTENYLRFLEDMRRYGRRILVWGPPASQCDGLSYNPQIPVYGPEIERNAATAMFHKCMTEAAAAASEHLTFVSILRELLLPNNVTRKFYYYDGTHLAQSAMPMAMAALEKATGWCPRWQPAVHDPVTPAEMFEPPRAVNIAPKAAWRMIARTVTADGNPLAADPLLRKPVRSPEQTDPTLVIELRTVRCVSEVRISFASDAVAADLDGIRLLVSPDSANYKLFEGTPPEVSGPLRIYRFPNSDIRTLQLIRIGKNMVLEVAGVEVIAKGYIAPA